MDANANVNDLTSLKVVYPLEAYEADAGENSMARATTRRGLHIETAPDSDGAFRVVRAAHSAADQPNKRDTVFLCPYMGREYGHFALQGGKRGAVEEKQNIFESQDDEYTAFLEAVIAAAKDMRPAPQADPRRLTGFGGA